MVKKILVTLASILLLVTTAYTADSVPLMDKESLHSLLDSKDLIILDARSSGDWETSRKKIKGAIRASKQDYATWKTVYPKEKTIVLYCS